MRRNSRLRIALPLFLVILIGRMRHTRLQNTMGKYMPTSLSNLLEWIDKYIKLENFDLALKNRDSRRDSKRARD